MGTFPLCTFSMCTFPSCTLTMCTFATLITRKPLAVGITNWNYLAHVITILTDQITFTFKQLKIFLHDLNDVDVDVRSSAKRFLGKLVLRDTRRATSRATTTAARSNKWFECKNADQDQTTEQVGKHWKMDIPAGQHEYRREHRWHQIISMLSQQIIRFIKESIPNYRVS